MIASKLCVFCDLSEKDNAKHLILQCPAFQEESTRMFNEIREIPDGTGALLLDNCTDMFSVVMGRHKENYMIEQTEKIWLITGKYVNLMYGLIIKRRKGAARVDIPIQCPSFNSITTASSTRTMRF